MITWLQLLVGTALVLWPGRAVARAFGGGGAAESFAWSVAVFVVGVLFFISREREFAVRL